MTRNQLQRQADAETARSNREKEAETYRNHIEMENITRQNNAYNQYLQEKQLNEQIRANRARELETNRSNLENERQRRDTLGATYDTLSETIQHNRNQESTNLLLASTQGRLANEQIRANLASEALRNQSNIIQSRSVSNTAEKNKYDRAYNISKLEEEKRANQAREQINRQNQILTSMSALTGSGAFRLARKVGLMK